MKRLMMLGVAAIVSSVAVEASALSLADARAQIGAVAESPAKAGEIVAQLDAADQVAFLGELNAAIEALPAQAEEKTAKFIEANESALKASKSGNLQAMLAETFATVPVESLTILHERLAYDLFDRSADPSVSDDDFLRRATETLKVIKARCESADNSAVRETFAILMFLRASKGLPPSLRDDLLGLMDDKSRELAANEWIPAAMGEGQDKSYDPMLGASDAGAAPEPTVVLDIAAPAVLTTMLGDLGSSTSSSGPSMTDSAFSLDSLGLPESTDNSGMSRVPVTADPTKKYFGGYKRGGGEPEGYQLQSY